MYTKMSTEMPTKVDALSVQNALEGPHKDSQESGHWKVSSAHGNLRESVLGQFSHVLFSHVLFLGQSRRRRTWKAEGEHEICSEHCPQLCDPVCLVQSLFRASGQK